MDRETGMKPAINTPTKVLRRASLHINAFHLISAGTILFFLAIWTVLSETRTIPPLFLPSPSDVIKRLEQSSSEILQNFGLTAYRVSLGFAIGSAIGILMAMLMNWNKWTRGMIDPVIQILKPIPPVALAPFVILWFSIGLKGILFLVVWGCFFVMVVDTTEAIKTVSPIWVWAASCFGYKKRAIYLRVILPAILPAIMGGLRVSLVMAFNQVILAEFNEASGGIGQLVIKGYRYARVDLLFFGIICVVLVAVIGDLLLILLGKRITHWV